MELNSINFEHDGINLSNGTLIFSEENLLKANALKINNIKLDLKIHQKLVLLYLISLEKNSKFEIKEDNICIKTNYLFYCDPTGSGKSIVMLALLLNSEIKNNSEDQRIQDINRLYRYSYDENIIFPNLPRREVYSTNYRSCRKFKLLNLSVIVVPHNIILQWENYIKSFTIGASYMMIYKNLIYNFALGKI